MNKLKQIWNCRMAMAVVAVALWGAGAPEALATPLRVLGLDVSSYQDGAFNSQSTWNNYYASGRVFVNIRASRGGSTTTNGRLDDTGYIFHINAATSAGMFAGSYHYGRLDISTCTATDEADHFYQMAGPWMRPGYLPPVFDFEESGTKTDTQMAQYCIDFANEIYTKAGIHPSIYFDGSHCGYLGDASVSASLKNQLAQPPPNLPTNVVPSAVSPDYPMIWCARYDSSNIQGGNPSDTASTFYGPWDDYGVTQPWALWQYSTSGGTLDLDVSHGDIEYLKNFLIPAVWMNDSSGDWGTLANWNSGQPTNQPPSVAGQLASGPLPTPRLPGAAGTGPTSGQYDTVILERPDHNITVTLSSNAFNIRKLYMRETLNITGGSLTINYDPTYRPDDSTIVLHGGPVSAQFSGPVTLSGGAGLNVHTLQVDATRTFTVNGSSLAFNKIILMPDAVIPGKLNLTGDVDISAFSGSTAIITNGTGSSGSGRVTLGNPTRAFNVAEGVNLLVEVPVFNGGLTKGGLGTMRLDAANSYPGNTTISSGILEVGALGSILGNVTNSAGTLKLDNISAMASGATLALSNSPAAGAVNLNFTGTQTINALYFGTVQQPAGTWGASGSGADHINAAFTGSGKLNVTTGPVASTTTLNRTSGSNPSTYGDSLTFTAAVTGNSPTGTVQFDIDGVAAGDPVTLVGGSAALVTNTLPVPGSPHQVTAYYNGDINNTPSSAPPLWQTNTAKALTAALTGSVSKTYDGTTVAALAPGNYSLPGVLNGDTVNLNNPTSGTYNTRDVGSGKSVTVTGLAISGSSASNYTLTSTSASGAIGVISQTNLTVTAAPNTKTYDGTATAAATPTITAGSIQTGDSAPTWTETYDTKNVGTGKTLTPAGMVNDANGGANYKVTYAINTSGVINTLTTACLLASSASPTGPGTNVTFTAAVNGAPPAADLPTGNVVFSANGTPFATNALVSGSITADTASLPLGTNAMTAQYVGDGNFLGSTGGLDQVVKLFTTCSQTNALVDIVKNPDSTFTLTFVGTPQADYYVLASPDMAAPMNNWTPLADSTNTVTNSSGLWRFIVTNTAPQQFYRSTAVTPCE